MLLTALWVRGEEGREEEETRLKATLGTASSQTAATAKLEWMVFAPQGKSRLKVSLSRTQRKSMPRKWW